MIKNTLNRRQHPRYRIDKTVVVPIHVFPVLPFLGEAVDAQLVNISATGMAIISNFSLTKKKVTKGMKLKVHFRLPGHPLCETNATVVRIVKYEDGQTMLGLRFNKAPSYLTQAIEKSLGSQGRNSIELALQHFD